MDSTDESEGKTDPTEQYFSPEYQKHLNSEAVVLGHTNFVVTATGSNAIQSVSINDTGNVRDDKSNIVRIFLAQGTPFSGYSPIFVRTFLGEEFIPADIPKSITKYKPGTLYIFFALKPNLGVFKAGLKGDELVHVQDVQNSKKIITIKVNFHKKLRPTHCLEEKYQKKKRNWMNLHVIMVYKQNSESPFSTVTIIEPFRFRSNSGKTSRIYSNKKRKRQDTDWEEDVTEFPIKTEPFGERSVTSDGDRHDPPSADRYHNPNLAVTTHVTTEAHGRREVTSATTTHVVELSPHPHATTTTTTTTLSDPDIDLNRAPEDVQPYHNYDAPILVPATPVIYRIYPNRCFAFQVWDNDSPDVTTILLGTHLDAANIRVGFVHPLRHSICIAFPRIQPTAREYMVPCIRRLLEGDDVIALPEAGLVVDVLFYGDFGEIFQQSQYYTYINFRPMAQLSFYGTSVPASGSDLAFASGQTSGSSLVCQPESYNLPNQVNEDEITKYFVNSKLDEKKLDKDGRSALHIATLLGCCSVVEYILAQKPDVNLQDKWMCTALHYAVFNGRTDITKLLLGAGAKSDILDCNDDSPLSLAIEWEEIQIIDLIFKSAPAALETIRGDLGPERLQAATAWLKLLTGKFLHWRSGILPFIKGIGRMVCAAATLEQPKFVRYDSNSDTYSMKVGFIDTMVRALFPTKKREFAPTEMRPAGIRDILISPVSQDVDSSHATHQEDDNITALRASLEKTATNNTTLTFEIAELPISVVATGSRNKGGSDAQDPSANGDKPEKDPEEQQDPPKSDK